MRRKKADQEVVDIVEESTKKIKQQEANLRFMAEGMEIINKELVGLEQSLIKSGQRSKRDLERQLKRENRRRKFRGEKPLGMLPTQEGLLKSYIRGLSPEQQQEAKRRLNAAEAEGPVSFEQAARIIGDVKSGRSENEPIEKW